MTNINTFGVEYASAVHAVKASLKPSWQQVLKYVAAASFCAILLLLVVYGYFVAVELSNIAFNL